MRESERGVGWKCALFDTKTRSRQLQDGSKRKFRVPRIDCALLRRFFSHHFSERWGYNSQSHCIIESTFANNHASVSVISHVAARIKDACQVLIENGRFTSTRV